MCESITKQFLRGCGEQTKIEKSEDLAAFFRKNIPAGCHAALLFSEGESPERIRRFMEMLAGFSPRTAMLGEGSVMSLFSLPDDVRAAVGVGARAITAARFFTTLRGGICVALPDSPSADGCFEREAPPPFAGYPLRFPDLIALSTNEMCRSEGTALAETALCALCAEELRTDALFSGTEHDVSPFERLTEEVRTLCRKGAISREKLFCVSASFLIALQKYSRFACLGFDRFLKRRMPQNAAQSSFAVLKYSAKRYVSLFERAVPRAYFVPDYVARVKRAANELGASPKTIFANVRVPTAAESFARIGIFTESRRRMAVSARLLESFVRDVACAYCAKEREKSVRFPLEEGYDVSAECTPLLCAPALEREFGLSPRFAVRV